MTEKRFTLAYENGNWWAVRDGGITLWKEEVVALLNQLNDENEQLKQSYIQLKHRHCLLHDVCLDAECDRDGYHKDVLSLEKENKQLKQRNENQYNQLTEVWGLIHRREWEILVDMDNKMKEDEERLRNEWKCYE